MPALLLDVGGVVIRTPFELLAAAERARGLAHGSLGPRGPFGPASADPAFDEVRTGRRTERAYWAERADRLAPSLGTEASTTAVMRALFALPRDDVLRPETVRLIDRALARGTEVGVLTNDLADFHGEGWFDTLAVLPPTAPVVDGSRTGVLKPDPRAYAAAGEALGREPGDIVYLDDQPVNVAAGRRAGLIALHLDPRDPEPAIAEAVARLGC